MTEVRLEAAVRKALARHPKLNERIIDIVEYALGLDHDIYGVDPEVERALRIIRDIVADLSDALDEQIRYARWTIEHIRHMGIEVEE
jgi:hypothetical protein